MNQDLRYGTWDRNHFLSVFTQYMELCNAISDGIRPWGGRILMMPIVPLTRVRYGESTYDFFRSVRAFNQRIRRLPQFVTANAVYEMAGFHAFRRDGVALRDGVHMTYPILHAIIVDIRRNYFNF